MCTLTVRGSKMSYLLDVTAVCLVHPATASGHMNNSIPSVLLSQEDKLKYWTFYMRACVKACMWVCLCHCVYLNKWPTLGWGQSITEREGQSAISCFPSMQTHCFTAQRLTCTVKTVFLCTLSISQEAPGWRASSPLTYNHAKRLTEGRDVRDA